MKKIISLMMLVTSITETTIAQEIPAFSNTDKTFEIPVNFIRRSFIVDLGKGNKMQLDLSEISDLEHFENIDSLLGIFLQDIVPLKDSLLDELASKRIDYLVDQLGRKKIRVQVFRPKGSSFLMQQGNLSALKLEQDTVNFLGTYSHIVTSPLQKSYIETLYYRLSFFVNQLSELNSYIGIGLNEKISTIQKKAKTRWVKTSDGYWHIKNGDKTIYSNHQPAGFNSGRGDYITSLAAVSIQNYKNYFTPSFSLGVGLGFNNGRVKNEFGLLWEPHFFFAKNAQNNLQTYRNDFLTFTYNRSNLRKENAFQNIAFISAFSFGYLIRRSGDLLEKNTMRIGVGQVSLFKDKIKVEPVLYFNNFFKGITPGVRLSVNF